MKFGCPGTNFLAPRRMEKEKSSDDEKNFRQGRVKKRAEMRIQRRKLMSYY